METLWNTIHRDLTDNGSLSTYKVDVKELTNHLEQIYDVIEELRSEIRQLKGE
jgi:hypothetical protein